MKLPLHGLHLALLAAAVPAFAQDAKPPEEVVVTATPLRQTVIEAVQPTLVLAGEDLVRLREPSLGETLAAQPGITASYFGPAASRPVIRGLGGERVQMYEDSTEALDVSALSSDHAVTIDPLVADQVEVVRGPAALLYGNGAAGGLVNVLTNRIPASLPERPLESAVEVRGNSALRERAAAGRLDGATGRFAFHADGFGRRTDDVRIPGFALSRALRAALAAEGEEVDATRRRLPNSDSETYGGALGGAWIGVRALFGLAASRFRSEYGVLLGHEEHHEEADPDAAEGLAALQELAGEDGVRIDMAQTRYELKSELRDPFRGFTNARIRAARSDYEHRELEADGAVGTRFGQRGVDSRLSLDHAPLGGWRGTFGVQYRDVDLTAEGEEAFLPDFETRNIGWFVYEQRDFGRFSLDLGARLEQQRIGAGSDAGALPRYDRTSTSASAGLLWPLGAGHTLALNLTSTERHPTATELFADGPHIAVQRFEVGDPTLRRERATTVDFGVRRQAGPWGMSLAAFYSDYSRYIFAAPSGAEADELPVVQYVQGDARFAGIEGELRLPVLATRAGTLSTRLMGDYVRARLAGGADLPQIPPLRIGAAAELARGPLLAGLTVLHHDAQRRVAQNELPTDGYTLVSVDLAWRVPLAGRQLLLFVRGENLLDETARRHASPLKDLAPLPGRALAGGVRLQF